VVTEAITGRLAIVRTVEGHVYGAIDNTADRLSTAVKPQSGALAARQTVVSAATHMKSRDWYGVESNRSSFRATSASACA
jgi:hypothetical protein